MPASDEWILKAMNLPHEKLVEYTAQFLENKAKAWRKTNKSKAASSGLTAVRDKSGAIRFWKRRPQAKK